MEQDKRPGAVQNRSLGVGGRRGGCTEWRVPLLRCGCQALPRAVSPWGSVQLRAPSQMSQDPAQWAELFCTAPELGVCGGGAHSPF